MNQIDNLIEQKIPKQNTHLKDKYPKVMIGQMTSVVGGDCTTTSHR